MKKMIEIIEQDSARICKNVDLTSLAGKKVLVSGASGLLGLYFLASLRFLNSQLKNPVNVYAVIHSEPNALFLELFKINHFHIIKGNMSESDFINSLPEADVIIHAAGYGQPGKFTSDPVKTIELNTVGTLSLLRRLVKNGHFLFTSSAEVYTGLTKTPFKETEIGTTNTTHPRSCYIEGKRSGEAICQAFRSQGVQAKSARIALTYGPGTRPGDSRVLNMLIEKGLKGTIQLMDQGDALRSFLYVSDAVEMMWNILLKGSEPVYNVAGHQEISIFDLAKKIGENLKVDVKKSEHNRGMPGAPVVVRLDTSLYEKEFGKIQNLDLETGLNRTIEWQSEMYCSVN